jgi:predicted RNase H-like HicB family nuclease
MRISQRYPDFMAKKVRSVFLARAVRDGNWWAMSVDEVPGAHSQARTRDEVAPMAREVISMTLDIPMHSFDLAIYVRDDAAA